MNQLEEIREMLGRLAQLTADDLKSLRDKIVDAFDEIDALDATAENVALLNELTESGEQVMQAQTDIETAAAELEQAKADARARRDRISGKVDDTTDAGSGDADADADADAGATDTADAPADPVTASSTPGAGAIRRMAARAGTPKASPESDDAPRVRGALVASAALGANRNGTVIKDRYELAEEMTGLLNRMKRTDKATGDVLVASAEWTYPEERRLSSGPGESLSLEDAKKMDAVTHPMALVASGGICAPVNVDWSLGTWAVADRPIRDGLPAFQATRGGLTFRTPPDYSGLTGATTIWSEATDASPGLATKPVLQIACPSVQTVYVNAVPTRIGFGNMEARFDPETVAANTDLAIAAAAHVAEQELLTLIQAASTGTVTTSAYLGASRDMLRILDQFMAAYRDLHRLSSNQVVTMIFPRWAVDIFRADRVAEIGHDGQSVDPLAIPLEYIESALRLRNINPIWHLDGLAAGSNFPNQYFGAFSAGAIPTWPDKMAIQVFLEGSIQFLDGGRLDLGVVRDSLLDATNDYETFTETFEGIAARGFSNSAITLSIDVVPNGATAGTVTPTSWS